MFRVCRLGVFSFCLVFGSVSLFGQEPAQQAIANWPAPAFWHPPSGWRVSQGSGEPSGLGPGEIGVLAEATSPFPFVGITPCRIADTRGNGFTDQAGPPALSANLTRNFQITGTVPGVPAQCGIPSGAAAVSFNFAVTNITANGNLIAFPAGGAPPTVSSLNWQVGFAALSNAAVIQLSDAGALGVQVNAAGGTTVDLIIDVNGYYGGLTGFPSNVFLGPFAGNSTMTGCCNTGVGSLTLNRNTTGINNVAMGDEALSNNDTGSNNTGIGRNALRFNIGYVNTALGSQALALNTTGSDNTASGTEALRNNTIGDFNTASGEEALYSNTTGSGNIAIGRKAGFDLTTGNNNIDIGSSGVAGESRTIRIGFAQTATFIAGINFQESAGGIAVFVNGDGKLGTTTSSRRFKENIREIAEESDGLMRLRPVAFRYKPEIDPTGLAQYGLIAEEVAQVYPDLVVSDRDGKPETVRYHLVNALLLNEVQKQRRTIEELRARLSRLEARFSAESRP